MVHRLDDVSGTGTRIRRALTKWLGVRRSQYKGIVYQVTLVELKAVLELSEAKKASLLFWWNWTQAIFVNSVRGRGSGWTHQILRDQDRQEIVSPQTSEWVLPAHHPAYPTYKFLSLFFSVIGIGRQLCELGKQLQDHRTTASTLGERIEIPPEILHFKISPPSDRPLSGLKKGGTAVAVTKIIPHNYADFPSLIFVDPQGSAHRLDVGKKMHAALFKSPDPACCEAEVETEVIALLTLRSKSVLASDLNAKNTDCSSQVGNP